MRADIHDGQERQRSTHGPDTKAQDQSLHRSRPACNTRPVHTKWVIFVALVRSRDVSYALVSDRKAEVAHFAFVPRTDTKHMCPRVFVSQKITTDQQIVRDLPAAITSHCQG